MVLQDLSKSVFINLADPNNGVADWETREQLVSYLRELSKQARRLIDIDAGNFMHLQPGTVDELGGAAFGLEFSADKFELYQKPVQEVRDIIIERKNEIESKLLGYKQIIGFEKDFHYYGAMLKTLIKVLELTATMEDTDNKIQEEVNTYSPMIRG